MIAFLKSRLTHAVIVFIGGIVTCLIFQHVACGPPTPERIVERIRISPQTEGATGDVIENYKRENAGLKEANRRYQYELWAAGETIAGLKATVGRYETQERVAGYHYWEWTERGGGTGCVERSTMAVKMSFNEWRIPITYEFGYLPDGRPVTFINADDPEITLTETTLYAKDKYEKPWYKKFSGGVYSGYGDGLTIMGTFGWDGWTAAVSRDRAGETYMFGKQINFF